MKQNYVTVTLCIHVTQPEISSKTASECLPISYAHRQPGHFVCEQPENMPPTASTGCVSARVSKHKGNTHTHTRLTALFPGLPGWAGTRKVKPIWILLKQETVNGSGISWTICKSASRSRQITMPVLHHSVFYRPDALPAAQPTASKHWRQKHKGNNQTNHPLVSALLDPQTNSWGKRHCTRFKQDLRCQHLTESYYCKTGICHLYSARLTWKKINSSSNIYSISDVQTSTYLKTKNKLKCGVAHVNFPWRNKHVG